MKKIEPVKKISAEFTVEDNFENSDKSTDESL